MIRCLPEELVVVQTLKPAADAAGRNGEGVSLKNALMAWVEVHIDQGNAAQVTVTIEQCTAVAGTGNKAIPVVPIWANQDYGTASPLTRQTDAVNFQTSVAVKQKKLIFQIDPSILDVANNFDCIRAVTSASNAANITQAEVRIAPRYPQSGQLDGKLD
jgi:hypothetical protein